MMRAIPHHTRAYEFGMSILVCLTVAGIIVPVVFAARHAPQALAGRALVLHVGNKTYVLKSRADHMAQNRVFDNGNTALGTNIVYADQRQQWALDLLARLGNREPNYEIMAFIVAWTQAEDRSKNAFDRYNPLNTTQPASGSWTINSDGVKGYPDYEIGMVATLETLAANHPGYAEIVVGLQTNDVELALAGLRASPWGTHGGMAETIYRQALSQNAPQGPQEARSGAIGGKSVVTEGMDISAGFYDTGAAAWSGGIHGGVDFAAPQGSPVYMPFDCAYTMTGYYGDPGRLGYYLMCHITQDGFEYYSGHLQGVQPFSDGQMIPAGTHIGYTNEYAHTHVQLRDTLGNLVNFEAYYNEY
jgi:murein DD-endopeptidase MepM/ murein hydrolase activator NlpD